MMHDFPGKIQTATANDRELIRHYAETGSEEAFATLMHRHLRQVYSFCKHQTRDTNTAEDATQVVFLLLSRKARTLRNVEYLSGWLFQTARLVCRNLHRRQARQRQHEIPLDIPTQSSLAANIETHNLTHEPLLSDALSSLRPKDLHLILLRFFEEREFAEIGNQLGISEDAARMRVNRALGKIRTYLTARGVHPDSEETIAAALAPTAFLVPVPLSCQTAIAEQARISALGEGIFHLPTDNPLRLTFEGVIRTMRFQTIRPIITIAAVGLVSALLIGVGNLRAAVSPFPADSPQQPVPMASPVEQRWQILMKFRLIERLTDESGTPQDKVLNAPVLSAWSDQKAAVTLSTDPLSAKGTQWKTETLPHLNTDGTINLKLNYHIEEIVSGTEDGAASEETVKEQKVTSKLRLLPNKPARVSLMKGPRSEFLLEVTADKIAPDNTRK